MQHVSKIQWIETITYLLLLISLYKVRMSVYYYYYYYYGTISVLTKYATYI